jgi:hypothetical protein
MQGACCDQDPQLFASTLANGDQVSLRGLQAATTFHGIELTNIYICMALWAASALHFSIFRHSSTMIFAACLGVPPFASALVNLLLLGSEGTYPHLATWVRGPLPALFTFLKTKSQVVYTLSQIFSSSTPIIHACSSGVTVAAAAPGRSLVAGHPLDRKQDHRQSAGTFPSIALLSLCA